MQLPDVNALVYAHRIELPEHSVYDPWFTELVNGTKPFAICDFVISGFIRVVTNPRVFKRPTSLAQALSFGNSLRIHPLSTVITSGPRHWSIFSKLCRDTGASGNAIADAYLAALAIEHGCEFVTAGRGLKNSEGLRLRDISTPRS